NELAHHPNLGIGFGAIRFVVANVIPAPAVVAVDVDLDAVVNIDLFRAHSRRANELYLLGFAVAQSSGAFESIEVVLVECLLGDGWNESPSNYNHLASHPAASTDPFRLNLVHVPGHELYTRVLERLACLVVHGDPTHDV